MLEISVELIGEDLPDLTKGQISRITRSVAARVRNAMVKNTPVGLGPSKGETKRSWTGVRKTEGGYSFENTAIQSLSLELGSASGKRPWPNARTRTIYSEGRIYSSQAPAGITTKAEIDTVAEDSANELVIKLLKGESLAK